MGVMDFTGVSAFPLTPMRQGRINFRELTRIVERLDVSGVSSIGALGSTGSYMYLSTAQRTNVVRAVVDSTDKPVIAGIGDLTLENVLKHATSAQKAGASALMLAPVGYQRLTPDEVFGLFYQVDRVTDLPVVLYDNPETTGFTFTDDLYRSIASLPSVASIKVPPPAKDRVGARIGQLKKDFPDLALGISGDSVAVPALGAGADLWYSVIGGTLPELALALARAAQNPESEQAKQLVKLVQPLYGICAQYGSYRTVDALALVAGLMGQSSLVLPVKSIPAHTQGVLQQWYELYCGYVKKGLLS